MPNVRMLSCLLLVIAVACGPSGRPGAGGPGGGGGGEPDALGPCVATAENTPAACSDSQDNDCDGLFDCSDPDCSGIGACPVCGMVQHPLSSPLALPDGIVGSSCTTNAQCSGGTPNCVEGECHASYTSSLHFDGFGPTQTFAAVSNIQSVCVTMEHSWLRDVEISLKAPSGEMIPLHKFLGRTGGEIYAGMANDCDTASSPVPGTGADYCWTPTATKPAMLPYADGGGQMNSVNGCDGTTHEELPPGDYSAAGQWSSLIGATLNGDWQIVVTDLWPIDNGYIFKWSIAFDPTIVQDCSGPVLQ